MAFKSLEDKCLYYRSLTDYRLMPNCYVVCMLDGRSFSRNIKNKFEKPFSDAFINMMNQTAKYLCENVMTCKFAYVQSDEITLVLSDVNGENADTFFGYRLCKLQSILASTCISFTGTPAPSPAPNDFTIPNVSSDTAMLSDI